MKFVDQCEYILWLAYVALSLHTLKWDLHYPNALHLLAASISSSADH